MRILVVYEAKSPGTVTGSRYLATALQAIGDVALFELDEAWREIASRGLRADVVMAHDTLAASSLCRYLRRGRSHVRAYYFVPAKTCHLERQELEVFDGTVSSGGPIHADVPHLQWCFDLPGRFSPVIPIAQREPRVLYVGRLEAGKLSPSVVDAQIGSCLDALGEGNDPVLSGALEKASARGAKTQYGWVPNGRIEQIYNRYRFYGMFAKEVFGLAALEAVYCGCMVLAMNESGESPPWMVYQNGVCSTAAEVDAKFQEYQSMRSQALGALIEARQREVRLAMNAMACMKRLESITLRQCRVAMPTTLLQEDATQG